MSVTNSPSRVQSSIHELSEEVRRVKQRRAPIDSKIEAIETLVGDFILEPLGAAEPRRLSTLPPISRIRASLEAPELLLPSQREPPVKSDESVERETPPPKKAEAAAVYYATTLSEALDILDTKIHLFLQTADTLASALRPCPELDWSPAVIALCKAFEVETVDTVLVPLREKSTGRDLRADLEDKEMEPVAKYCCDKTARPPEMGTLARFLQTAIHSRRRRESSKLLQAFYEVLAFWPRSKWIVETAGLTAALKRLTTEFRNRAAHIERMTETEFVNCSRFLRDHPEEIILRLFLATRLH